jgi:catechol 2,3-dioxygenase-like lactoylglutathione lyase family enzyme
VPLQLDNVRLLTDVFPATFRFYADALGLPVLFGTAEGPYAEFAAGAASIGLFARDEMPGAGTSAGDPAPAGDRAIIVLDAEPLDATLAQLRCRGVEVGAAHDRRRWGIRTAHLRDPDGRLLELFEPIQATGPQQH